MLGHPVYHAPIIDGLLLCLFAAFVFQAIGLRELVGKLCVVFNRADVVGLCLGRRMLASTVVRLPRTTGAVLAATDRVCVVSIETHACAAEKQRVFPFTS